MEVDKLSSALLAGWAGRQDCLKMEKWWVVDQGNHQELIKSKPKGTKKRDKASL